MIRAIYADGGVIGSNPSAEGGTWAWCQVDQDNQRVVSASGIVRPWGSMTHITNNLTEMIALTLGLESLPDGWEGLAYTDSAITLGRLSRGWKMEGIPPALQQRGLAAVRRLGRVRFVLLDGHPTRAQLTAGIGKRGNPVSEHNVWCDKACGVEARRTREEMVAA